jgi:hypothetical protein
LIGSHSFLAIFVSKQWWWLFILDLRICLFAGISFKKMETSSLLNMSLDDAITILTPQLRNVVKSPIAATQLLERLRLDMEDEVGTRKLVRSLQRLMPSPPHPTVVEQLLEMLPMLSHPSPVIEEIAKLIEPSCLLRGENRTMALLMERYTNALSDDRSLILPILGSLFDLPLIGEYAVSAADLGIEALGIVEEEVVGYEISSFIYILTTHYNSAISPPPFTILILLLLPLILNIVVSLLGCACCGENVTANG